jgi:hypothetical protein
MRGSYLYSLCILIFFVGLDTLSLILPPQLFILDWLLLLHLLFLSCSWIFGTNLVGEEEEPTFVCVSCILHILAAWKGRAEIIPQHEGGRIQGEQKTISKVYG